METSDLCSLKSQDILYQRAANRRTNQPVSMTYSQSCRFGDSPGRGRVATRSVNFALEKGYSCRTINGSWGARTYGHKGTLGG